MFSLYSFWIFLEILDNISLFDLNKRVIACNLCPRLMQYSVYIGRKKTKRFVNEQYWSRPVPSFGDPKAKVLIIGLAPAAHGGNRTGRMFTGDSSGDWLVRALFESKFANMQTSNHRDDGLVLNDIYVTSVIRCAPPKNRPLGSEIESCSRYLLNELEILKSVQIILTLGRTAFHTYCRVCHLKSLTFSHGKSYSIDKNKTLVASYHPSRQNTNTRRLSWKMWIDVFHTLRSLLRSDGK